LFVRCAVILLITVSLAGAAEIRGKITNAVGGEPLARVQVSLLEAKVETASSDDGRFAIRDLAPEHYTLRFNAVSDTDW